jgi:hypothetical protein
MAKGCGTIACHGGVAPPLLELIAPGVEARLINVPATYEAAEGLCPPTAELLIDTADPMASLLVKKLDGTQTCGDPMPQLMIMGFTDADKACIRSWALELAMNGSGAGGTTGAGGMPGAGGSGGVGGSGGSGGSGGTGGSGGGTGGSSGGTSGSGGGTSGNGGTGGTSGSGLSSGAGGSTGGSGGGN